ncbi:MAG: type II toxin-antitoxin system RelE/ParE family toxin [Rhodocyclaceae bacterium]|nr:type II toxin-antitoxin system RelE/ParE family toxin [Rhodocyclaceae bacterium]
MAEYRLTPAAERDLENIWLYTRRQWSTEQADRYTAILANAFAELCLAPKTAPRCDDVSSGYRRRSAGRHMIYFRVTDYGIAIVRVLHDRMDAPRHL